MKNFNLIWLLLGVVLFMFVGGLSSCSKNDDSLDFTTNESPDVSISSSQVVASAKMPLPYSPNPYSFDQVYSVNLSTYKHVYQNRIPGMCGPCTYVSARSIRYPNYPASYSNATTIKEQLDKAYGAGQWTVYHLYLRKDQTTKAEYSEPAGNMMWGYRRDELKDWIKNKISQGKPCVVPCLYGMSTNTSSAGHFYLIVSLYLKNDGHGSIVGVKDVWSPSSETFYSDLLSSIWINSQKFKGIGGESYAAMSFEWQSQKRRRDYFLSFLHLFWFI